MVDRVLTRVENTLAAVSFMLITAVAFANVVARYFLNVSMAFTSEITMNTAVWLTMVGAAIAMRERAHLGFTLLRDKAVGRGRVLLTALAAVVMALFLSVLMVYGWEQVMLQRETGRTTPSMQIPQWWFSLALPVGAGLALVRATQVAVADLRGGTRHGEPAGDLTGGPVL